MFSCSVVPPSRGQAPCAWPVLKSLIRINGGKQDPVPCTGSGVPGAALFLNSTLLETQKLNPQPFKTWHKSPAFWLRELVARLDSQRLLEFNS